MKKKEFKIYAEIKIIESQIDKFLKELEKRGGGKGRNCPQGESADKKPPPQKDITS